jgi:hypothetical protein
METFAGLVLVIAVVAGLIFFKGTISKIGDVTEDKVTGFANKIKLDTSKEMIDVDKKLNEIEKQHGRIITTHSVYKRFYDADNRSK